MGITRRTILAVIATMALMALGGMDAPKDPRIFRGDARNAFRDLAAVWYEGIFHLFFHGSGPRKEQEGDFDCNASIGVVRSDNPWFRVYE